MASSASGEQAEDAARRELREELGIDAGLEYVGHGAYRRRRRGRRGDRIWQVVHDGPFEFTDDEVVEACFVSLDELRDDSGRDPFVPDALALVATTLLGSARSPGPRSAPSVGGWVVGIRPEIKAQWRR